MKQKKLIIVFFLLVSTYSWCDSSVKQLQDLKSFMGRFVPECNRPLFKEYYESFLRSQQVTKQKAKNSKKMNSCAQAGRVALEANEADLVKEMATAKCPDRFCRTLYIRYGTYQQFLKEHAQESRSFVGKVRACAQDVKIRVTQWINSWRKTDCV